jgi:gliding motility-associated-like protein
MADGHNIEDLFKSSFESFEPEVSPHVWTAVSASAGVGTVTKASVSLGKVAVISGIVVGSLTIGIVSGYFAGSENEKKKQQQVQAQNETQNEEQTVSPEGETEELRNELETPAETIVEKPAHTSGFRATPSKGPETVQPQYSSGADRFITNPGFVPFTSDGESKPTANGNTSGATPENRNNDTPEVKAKLDLQITALPNGGSAPLHTSFKAEGNFSRIEWNFGDGTTAAINKPVHVYYEEGTYEVIARAWDKNGNSIQRNMVIEVLRSSAITNIPNLFTPNGDGQNDVLLVQGEKLEWMSMTIMNLAGEVIFQGEGQDVRWNGESMGQLVAEGDYLCLVVARGTDDKKHQKRLTVRVSY